jgi:hypothetical protein
VIAGTLDGRELASAAADVSAHVNLRITAEQVAYAAEHKLVPLGLVATCGRQPAEP